MATFYKMTELPNQNGYSVQHPYNLTRMQMEGGGSRYRKGKKNLPNIVAVSWIVDRDGYDYLKAFYELWQDQTPTILPFLCDLVIDFADLLEYSCFFTSGLKLTEVKGHAHYVSAEIEVSSKKRNRDQDEVIVLGILDLIKPLEELVNKNLPDALENLI